MNRLVLIVMSLLVLVLSACGTSEPFPSAENSPVEDEVLLDINISDLKLELPGCTLPALQKDTLKFSEVFQGCIFWGCIRYAAK